MVIMVVKVVMEVMVAMMVTDNGGQGPPSPPCWVTLRRIVELQLKKCLTRTKVESDRLGRLKISYEKQVKEFSQGLSWGAAVCTL